MHTYTTHMCGYTDPHTKTLYEVEGRNQGDASTSQTWSIPKIVSKLLEIR